MFTRLITYLLPDQRDDLDPARGFLVATAGSAFIWAAIITMLVAAAIPAIPDTWITF